MFYFEAHALIITDYLKIYKRFFLATLTAWATESLVGKLPILPVYELYPRGGAAGAPEHSVGLVVAGKLLFLRIPPERSIQQHRDIA
jgi:hypothetical protein